MVPAVEFIVFAIMLATEPVVSFVELATGPAAEPAIKPIMEFTIEPAAESATELTIKPTANTTAEPGYITISKAVSKGWTILSLLLRYRKP